MEVAMTTQIHEKEELVECLTLRKTLVDYMALNHTNHITSLAKELDCSVPLVSRYIRGERPMSSSFIKLVKNKLQGFNTTCDTALKAMGQMRWMQD